MAASFVQLDHTHESSGHNVIWFVVEGLLNELLKTLNVLFINNLGQNSQRIRFDNFIVTLLYVFAQAGYDYENLILIYFKLFDEDINEST